MCCRLYGERFCGRGDDHGVPDRRRQLPRYIHVGPDQHLWYAEVGASSGAIGRIGTAGEAYGPIYQTIKPVDLVAMPDGTVVWTRDDGGLGRRLPNGTVQLTGSPVGSAYAIALTAAGDLRWGFTTHGFPAPATGKVCRFTSDFEISSIACAQEPSGVLTKTRVTGLTLGADGRLWSAGIRRKRHRPHDPGRPTRLI